MRIRELECVTAFELESNVTILPGATLHPAPSRIAIASVPRGKVKARWLEQMRAFEEQLDVACALAVFATEGPHPWRAPQAQLVLALEDRHARIISPITR